MKKSLLMLCCLLLPLAATFAMGDPVTVSEGDTISSLLTAQQGKRLTLKLASGQELTGEVAEVNANVVHLRELAGREFFDALVDIADVEAIVVRAK